MEDQENCRVCNKPIVSFDLQGSLTRICSMGCSEKLDPAAMQEEWDYMYLAYKRLERKWEILNNIAKDVTFKDMPNMFYSGE